MFGSWSSFNNIKKDILMDAFYFSDILAYTRAIYFSFYGKTRYHINLVAVRQHIVLRSNISYQRVYRKSRKRFISIKKTIPKNSLFLVEGDGFEPSKQDATDLQSAPFGHSGTPPYSVESGAGDGTRTRNLLITNQLLCQLSYTSTGLGKSSIINFTLTIITYEGWFVKHFFYFFSWGCKLSEESVD